MLCFYQTWGVGGGPVHEWGSATLPDQNINYYFVFIHLWFSPTTELDLHGWMSGIWEGNAAVALSSLADGLGYAEFNIWIVNPVYELKEKKGRECGWAIKKWSDQNQWACRMLIVVEPTVCLRSQSYCLCLQVKPVLRAVCYISCGSVENNPLTGDVKKENRNWSTVSS